MAPEDMAKGGRGEQVGRRRGSSPRPPSLRCVLLGVGAMRSPRFAPAGLLVECAGRRVAIDGGGGPLKGLDAWLVTDAQTELMPRIRRLARASGVTPAVARFTAGPLDIAPRPVVHTSHRTFGYEVRVIQGRVVWAPEFLRFPRWARGAALMFAEAAGFSRPILFAGRVGGHASALSVCAAARRYGIQCLVLAHIGRPTIRALDRGWRPDFGEVGEDGAVYVLTSSGRVRKRSVR